MHRGFDTYRSGQMRFTRSRRADKQYIFIVFHESQRRIVFNFFFVDARLIIEIKVFHHLCVRKACCMYTCVDRSFLFEIHLFFRELIKGIDRRLRPFVYKIDIL